MIKATKKEQGSVVNKQSANEILLKHGPMSSLVRSLQRYALLGWFLFFLTLGAHFLLVMLSTLTPRPVIAVDESGRIIGNLEFLTANTRSDQELMAASMRYVQNFMSLNSETIFEDYAAAMNMMAPELLDKTRENILANNYLAVVAKAHTRSRITFGGGEAAPVVLGRKDLDADIRLRGTIFVFDGRVKGSVSEVKKPFDVTIHVRAVPRNSMNTAGIIILDWKDN